MVRVLDLDVLHSPHPFSSGEYVVQAPLFPSVAGGLVGVYLVEVSLIHVPQDPHVIFTFAVHLHIEITSNNYVFIYFCFLYFPYHRYHFFHDLLSLFRLGIYVYDFQVWLDITYIYMFRGVEVIPGHD